MTGPNISGVPCQTIMKVAERTIVLGRLVDRTMCGHVYWMEVMGTSFWYHEERLNHERKINLYGRPHAERIPVIRRVLKGSTWGAFVDHSTSTSNAGRQTWQHSVTGQMQLVNPAPSSTELKWGKTFYEFVSLGFEGNESDFKRDMLYASMVGTDNEDWEGVYGADKD